MLCSIVCVLCVLFELCCFFSGFSVHGVLAVGGDFRGKSIALTEVEAGFLT